MPALARWKTLQDSAKLPPGTGTEITNGKKTTCKITSTGKLIDDALDAVEKENPKLKGVLNKTYTQLQIDPANLSSLIDLIATIPFEHADLHAKDILGHGYEYFLGQFALAEGKQRGSDLRYDMQIGLEEAAFGCDKEIEVSKLEGCAVCNGTGAEQGSRAVTCPGCNGRGQVISSRGFFQVSQTCGRCRGTGTVIERPCRKCGGEGRAEMTSRIKLKIPPGIEDGSRLRSSKNGEAGIRGGPPGDLYVVIHIKEHEVFERDGDGLYCEIPISFTTASLGGEVEVPTLEGKAHLKIPAGTQGATVFKLRGKGIPSLNSTTRGDLMVRVLVEVPTKLNSEQRRKLEEFAALMGDDNTPLHKGFFEKAKEFFR